MLPSVSAFFAGILDYAGLFPPAQLPLDEAVRNYARYRTEPESWLLGRFVCPNNRVAELFMHGKPLFEPNNSFALALVITAAGGIPYEGEEGRAVRDFWRRYSDQLTIAIDRRGPPISLPEQFLGSQYVPRVYWEFEPKSGSSVRDFAGLLVRTGSNRHYGFKLRCGGPNAAAVPSVEHVAHVIAACRDAGVPLKFTAGLHHALRHDEDGLQTKLHGFVNVFAAGVLAHARKLNEEHLCEIVADEDAGHFTFAEGGFTWKDHCASVEEITAARQYGVISFGSCSFEEPRDDLRRLGLL